MFTHVYPFFPWKTPGFSHGDYTDDLSSVPKRSSDAGFVRVFQWVAMDIFWERSWIAPPKMVKWSISWSWLGINPSKLRWPDESFNIIMCFLWFCHVLSLLKLFKRTQQPLDPFDFPFWTQVFFNECVNELRSVGLKPLEMLTLEPHFTGSAVIVAANKKPGLKMVLLWKTLRFMCVVSGLCSWYSIPLICKTRILC